MAGEQILNLMTQLLLQEMAASNRAAASDLTYQRQLERDRRQLAEDLAKIRFTAELKPENREFSGARTLNDIASTAISEVNKLRRDFPPGEDPTELKKMTADTLVPYITQLRTLGNSSQYGPERALAYSLADMLGTIDPANPTSQSFERIRSLAKASGAPTQADTPGKGKETVISPSRIELPGGAGFVERGTPGAPEQAGTFSVRGGPRSGFSGTGTPADILAQLMAGRPESTSPSFSDREPTATKAKPRKAAKPAPADDRIFAGVPEAGAGGGAINPIEELFLSMMPRPSANVPGAPLMNVFGGVPEAGAGASGAPDLLQLLLNFASQEPI